MSRKILAIDDDEAFCLLLGETCAGEGREVRCARDGAEGLRMAREWHPDVILVDLMMPCIHGFEVCKAIRADAELAKAKVIVISAKGYQVDKRTAQEAGADHYLVKPFALPDLLPLLR